MINESRSDVAYYPGETITFTGVESSQCYNYEYNPIVHQYPGHFYATKEEMYTPNSKGPRKIWKDFEHYKAFRTSESISGPLPVATSGFATYGGNFCHYAGFGHGGRFGTVGYDGNSQNVRPLGEPGLPVEGLPAYRVYRSDGGFIPPPDNLEKLKALSAKTMLPSIKAELSALNSIIELKDFHSLPRTVSNLYSFLTRTFGGSSGGGSTLRHMFHPSGDGYLQAKFNVLPLLSDIAGIQHAILSTKRAIDNLLIRTRTVQTRHFAYNWDEFSDGAEQSSDAYLFFGTSENFPSFFWQYNGCYLSRTVRNSPSRFHAEIEYNYTLSRYEIENAQLLGFLDAFGVNANAAIIWNALPWSFVVDWVLGVSRWLDDHKTLNLEPKVVIRRYLWSVTRERQLFLRKNSLKLNGFPYGAVRSLTLPTVNESAYRRSNDSLEVNSLTSSGLSPTEISLGAALVIPRKWRPRKRH